MQRNLVLIRMLETKAGSPDGIHRFSYDRGGEYWVPPGLARLFLASKSCIQATETVSHSFDAPEVEATDDADTTDAGNESATETDAEATTGSAPVVDMAAVKEADMEKVNTVQITNVKEPEPPAKKQRKQRKFKAE